MRLSRWKIDFVELPCLLRLELTKLNIEQMNLVILTRKEGEATWHQTETTFQSREWSAIEIWPLSDSSAPPTEIAH
jgi:hypothetical protein